MKKLFSCLLMAVLLFSLTVAAGAEDVPNDEIAGAAPAAAEEANDTDDTDPYIAAAIGAFKSSRMADIPTASDLPEGYVIDPNFSVTFTLDDVNSWTYSLKDLFDDADSDEYIYFIVEEDVAEGYTATYSLKGAEDFTDASPVVSPGHVIVVKNTKEGEPPSYELPQSGGTGTTLYTVAGSVVLLAAAVYAFILHKRRKKNA